MLFILGELSHALELLAMRKHPHLWISPMTVYLNSNGNYFLHDLYNWHDGDYQSTP